MPDDSVGWVELSGMLADLSSYEGMLSYRNYIRMPLLFNDEEQEWLRRFVTRDRYFGSRSR